MGTDVFVLSPLLPLIAAHHGVTAAGAGWGVTVFAFAYAALAPIFGHHGDAHGRRAPIVGGLTALGLANGATAWAPTFPLFLVARLIAGAAAGAITPSVYAVTSDMAPDRERGAWLAIVGSGVFTALWSSAPAGALLADRFGWRSVFVLLGIVPLVLAAVNVKVLTDVPHAARPPVAGGYGRLLADVASTTIWGAALYATYTYLGTGLRLVAGADARGVALGVAVYGLGMMTGALTGGHIADRWGSRRVTTVSCLLMAVAVLAFRALSTRLGPALPALFAFPFTAALFFPAFQTHLAVRHAERRGAALAWNNSALYLGITAGSFFGGVILSRWGFREIPVLSAALALIALVWSRAVQRGA